MNSTVIKSTVIDDTTIEIRYNEDTMVHLYELWIGGTCMYSHAQYSSVLHEYNMEV